MRTVLFGTLPGFELSRWRWWGKWGETEISERRWRRWDKQCRLRQLLLAQEASVRHSFVACTCSKRIAYWHENLLIGTLFVLGGTGNTLKVKNKKNLDRQRPILTTNSRTLPIRSDSELSHAQLSSELPVLKHLIEPKRLIRGSASLLYFIGSGALALSIISLLVTDSQKEKTAHVPV
jgi:hypothetical protein